MNPLETFQNQTQRAQAMSCGEERVCRILEEITGEATDWNNWHWQMRHRIKTKDALARVIDLTPEEEAGIDGLKGKFTMAISPYFASLMDPQDPDCPIRRQCVPRKEELLTADEEMIDPCGEEKNSPVHGLVHRYPDRVLFLVNEMCATYCRYCTRSRMVGDGKRTLSHATYEAAFDYIRANPQIRDVLLSGGDPFILNDNLLEYLIRNIRAIKHVEFIRIGTRVPVTMPQRVTPRLVGMLKQYSPIWISLHFNHVKELAGPVRAACDLLADGGFPLGSQTVLLKGVNDDPKTMKDLMHGLLKARVRPYYIYQCDPVVGSTHFRAPVLDGIKIIEQLRGFTSGYAVPTYVIDAPGGGGKIPVGPDYVISRGEGKYVLRNYEGQTFEYTDPRIKGGKFFNDKGHKDTKSPGHKDSSKE